MLVWILRIITIIEVAMVTIEVVNLSAKALKSRHKNKP